jgi:hypothetical protein
MFERDFLGSVIDLLLQSLYLFTAAIPGGGCWAFSFLCNWLFGWGGVSFSANRRFLGCLCSLFVPHSSVSFQAVFLVTGITPVLVKGEVLLVRKWSVTSVALGKAEILARDTIWFIRSQFSNLPTPIAGGFNYYFFFLISIAVETSVRHCCCCCCCCSACTVRSDGRGRSSLVTAIILGPFGCYLHIVYPRQIFGSVTV